MIWSLLHDLFAIFGMGADLVVRLLRGRANREYAAYRLGRRIDSLPHADVWLHGVSTGEVLALDNLIAELRRQQPGVTIAVSTMTADGLEMIRKFKNAPDAAFIYPIDTSWWARRIVRKLRPKVLAIVDGDFWLQMLRACGRARVPVIVINGRLSERSVQSYLKLSSYSKRMFATISLASVQSDEMARRFAKFLPKDRIVVGGNLKLDSQAVSISDDHRDALRREFGINADRLTIVFGSIHPDELDVVASASRHILEARPDVQIVVVPRHPAKFATRPDLPEPVIWIARLGILRDLYQLADIAFVGGTFCDVGGHNLAEPALLGIATMYGPRIESQVPLHEILQSYRAAQQARSADELAANILTLVLDAAARGTVAANGLRLARDSSGLTTRIAERILSAATGR